MILCTIFSHPVSPFELMIMSNVVEVAKDCCAQEALCTKDEMD